ncbi:MAG: nucleotidyltransferase family protein [bacterium]|nr:nucleotidyltransferase family protein [bacterium]
MIEWSAQRLRPEELLCVNLVEPRRNPAALVRTLDCDLDWSLVMSVAGRHNVLTFLPALLDAPEAAERIPAGVRKTLRSVHKAAIFVDLLRTRVLRELIPAFELAGVPVLLLKGRGLAERLYANPERRTSTDTDLLVPSEYLKRAGALLEQEGYAPNAPEFYTRTHFHIPYVHHSRRYHGIVELHWSVTPQHSLIQFDIPGWWRRAQPTELCSGRILVPEAADEAAHLAWHAFNHGCVALRDLADIARLVADFDDDDWHLLHERSRDTGAIGFVKQAIILGHELWRTPRTLPRFVTEPPRPSRWIGRAMLRPETVVTRGRYLWWPLRQINYWSLLPRKRTNWIELCRRTLRDVYEERPGKRSFWKSARALATLGVALAMCIGGFDMREHGAVEETDLTDNAKKY